MSKESIGEIIPFPRQDVIGRELRDLTTEVVEGVESYVSVEQNALREAEDMLLRLAEINDPR